MREFPVGSVARLGMTEAEAIPYCTPEVGYDLAPIAGGRAAAVAKLRPGLSDADAEE